MAAGKVTHLTKPAHIKGLAELCQNPNYLVTLFGDQVVEINVKTNKYRIKNGAIWFNLADVDMSEDLQVYYLESVDIDDLWLGFELQYKRG